MNCSKYRFGFGGHEKDDEIYNSSGSSYTGHFWQYDSRLGRRWNRDPKPNPSISQYATFADNPILYSDPLGDTIKIRGTAKFIYNTQKNLQMIRATDIGRDLIAALEKSQQVFTVSEAHSIYGNEYDDRINNVRYDDNPWFWSDVEGGVYTSLQALSHELWHAFDDLKGRITRYKDELSYGEAKATEQGAVRFANYMRTVYQLGSLRTRYNKFGSNFLEGNISLPSNGERITNFQYSVKPISPEKHFGVDNTAITVPAVGSQSSISYDKVERNTREPAKRADAVREFKSQQD